MSSETTFLVQSSGGERKYQLYELTWLWRTGELPHDARFQDSSGEWRPVSELVEPILARGADAAGEKEHSRTAGAATPNRHLPHRWAGVIAWSVAVMVIIGAGVGLKQQYDAWMAARATERAAMERERAARMDDFISSSAVVLGMTREQVRRAIGEPRTIKATGDGVLERWMYRKQVIVFENGKVIGTESAP